MTDTEVYAVDYDNPSQKYDSVYTDKNGEFTYQLKAGDYNFRFYNKVHTNPYVIGSYYNYILTEKYTLSDDASLNIILPMSQVTGKTINQFNEPVGNIAIGYKSYEMIKTSTTNASAQGYAEVSVILSA